MSQKEKRIHHGVKQELHPENLHRHRYNFHDLIESCSGLSAFVYVNQYGDESIDFSDPDAVKMLNRALLKHFYGINWWDIPDNYLCPPIPGRADYIHYIADILRSSNNKIMPAGNSVSVLDIGTGANAVYPIIGNRLFGWHFTGTDIDPVSIGSAQKIIDSNTCLNNQIELRAQKSGSDIFRGIIKPDDFFDITMCNPPFHASQDEADSRTIRKINNLNSTSVKKPVLNFGGQNSELWTPGGEKSFINRMVKESEEFAGHCFWFTTLISKKTTLPEVLKTLKKIKAFDVKTIQMSQGHKISRIAAWTFLNPDQQKNWRRKRWNSGS